MARESLLSLNSAVEQAVAEAVSGLTSFDALNGRYRINLPIIMPSGGLIDVSAYPEPNGSFLVTDDGAAFFEVSGYGVTRRSFFTVAKDRAVRVGATFDGNAFLFVRVRADQLKAAIISIGNLSAEVAAEVVERSVVAKSEHSRDKLFSRIDEAFPGKSISHDVEIFGASTAPYKFDALVKLNGRSAAFDIFTKDPISIAAAYTKLSDVSRMDENPSLIGVTSDPDSIGPKLTLISSVARVIRIDAPADTLRQAAA